MAFVVTAPCVGCKHTECVGVCPVNCFREGEQMLYIDPDSCIDCAQCAEVCPTGAPMQEDDVPDVWREFIRLNAEMASVCPAITEKKGTPPG